MNLQVLAIRDNAADSNQPLTEVTMSIATATKLIFLLIWPVLILLILYFMDKEKFKRRIKKIFDRN